MISREQKLVLLIDSLCRGTACAMEIGQLLAPMERGTGPGRGNKVSGARTSFRQYLKEIGLPCPSAYPQHIEGRRLVAAVVASRCNGYAIRYRSRKNKRFHAAFLLLSEIHATELGGLFRRSMTSVNWRHRA